MQPEYDDDRPDTYDDMPLIISIVVVALILTIGLATWAAVQ